jgi:hypothetical protein
MLPDQSQVSIFEPVANKELREYIIGKDDFEYAAHTNRTDDFAIERRANLLNSKQRDLSWEETLNASGESFHNRNSLLYLMRRHFRMIIGFSERHGD